MKKKAGKEITKTEKQAEGKRKKKPDQVHKIKNLSI